MGGRSAAKEQLAGVFSRASSTYDGVIPYFETFARHLVEAAHLEPGMRVLDLACGRGACARAAAEVVGPGGFVVGIDLAEGMVASTAADLRGAGIRNVHVQAGDAEDLDLVDGSFDAVVCGLAVFFFPNPLRALRECRRVLAPAGRFAASTFRDGVGGYPWLAEAARAVGKERPVADSRVLTSAGLRDALQRVGFGELLTTEVEGRFIFRDVDEFLAWSWSTAGRRLLEQLNDADMDAYRAACAEEIAAHAADDGYEFRQAVELTTATRDTKS
jgi:ubiquinone/menaquinone biosynthesis C-methylase UbiE